MYTTATKIGLVALLFTGILAAFPEPFDMHCTLHELIEEKMALDQKLSSEDWLAGGVKPPDDNSSSRSSEPQTVDTSSSQDAR